jgi:hypothetical protein
MILEGVSLGDLKQVRVADCQVSDNEISCKVREGTLRLKHEGPLQLMYSYPFPFPTSFTTILKNYKPPQNQATPIKLAMLEEVKHKMQLTEVSGQLHAEGTEKLTIGEYIFDTEKYLSGNQGWGAENHTVDEESRNRVRHGGFTVSSRASHRAYPVQEILRLLSHALNSMIRPDKRLRETDPPRCPG